MVLFVLFTNIFGAAVINMSSGRNVIYVFFAQYVKRICGHSGDNICLAARDTYGLSVICIADLCGVGSKIESAVHFCAVYYDTISNLWSAVCGLFFCIACA